MADTSPLDTGDPRPATPPWREALALAALVAVAVALASWWTGRPEPNRAAPRRALTIDPSLFVGARECRECHPGEYAAFTGSGHARTLRKAGGTDLARWLDGRSFADPERPSARWSYRVEDGALIAERVEGGERAEHRLDYALGSGNHATTLVSWLGGSPPHGLEHRLTFFAKDGTLGVTPGQEGGNPEPGRTADGFELPPAVMLDCFACHATKTSDSLAPRLDEAGLVPNVACERCHGPGRAHVEAARRGDPEARLAMPFGSGAEPARDQVRLCGRCHRLPEMVPRETIRPETRAIARFPSVGLLQSACYRKSNGEMTCSTCHDPHGRASTDAAVYETSCMSCHAAGSKSACPVSPRTGCVGCHMPKRDVGHGLEFTDHWIRAKPGE